MTKRITTINLAKYLILIIMRHAAVIYRIIYFIIEGSDNALFI